MTDLLARLREDRAKHFEVTREHFSFCHLCEAPEWPCPTARALDCAIAGVEALTPMESTWYRNVITAMQRAYEGGDHE